jgi:hypothetical protein
MNKIHTKSNEQLFNKDKASRWDRINRIIRDGITKSFDNNDYYFAKFITALGEYSAVNTNCLSGII